MINDITIEALKAAGFEPLGDGVLGWCYEWQFSQPTLTFDKGKVELWAREFGGGSDNQNTVRLHPTSMVQIETLKELLTPK